MPSRLRLGPLQQPALRDCLPCVGLPCVGVEGGYPTAPLSHALLLPNMLCPSPSGVRNALQTVHVFEPSAV
jgi:hypothetical protein